MKRRLFGVLRHKPVLLQEAVQSLNLKPDSVVLDGTLGSGGHSREILSLLGPRGLLISLDRDNDAVLRCAKHYERDERWVCRQSNFSDADDVLDLLKIEKLDGALLDLGFSSDQLESGERGFSFDRPGPLDMRMDASGGQTAADLLRDLTRYELEHLFVRFGEERWARKFAERICLVRSKTPIETTQDLVRVINEALPRAYSYPAGKRPPWARHHPATKVFQALRIAVNQELENLASALPKIFSRLKRGGRMSVISFHSLEDRIVKQQFKAWHIQKQGALIYKKPVEASDAEVNENPRSRSAKLRTIEKL